MTGCFTAQDKADAAEREVRLRRRVYANRVKTGRMTQAMADWQIAIMEEIVEDYRIQADLDMPTLL